MTIRWELVDETLRPDQRAWLTECAWAEWAKHSCVERNGGHLWLAELLCIEDGGRVALSCESCPAGVDDLYPDGVDLIFGEVDGVPIEYGRQRSLDPYDAPVTAEVVNESYYSHYYGAYEYDVWILVESRPWTPMPALAIEPVT